MAIAIKRTIFILQVTDRTHAFLEGTEFLQYLVILYHLSATTYFLPETIFQIYVGWIYPKNTPWKHKFDTYLQAFVESGLCRYWKKVRLYQQTKFTKVTLAAYDYHPDVVIVLMHLCSICNKLVSKEPHKYFIEMQLTTDFYNQVCLNLFFYTNCVLMENYQKPFNYLI